MSKEQPETEAMLEEARTLTDLMREHQNAVKRLGEKRRVVIRSLRDHNVSFRVIAASCGVTDQALFADLRKHPSTGEPQ
jgi:hypothetical protein